MLYFIHMGELRQTLSRSTFQPKMLVILGMQCELNVNNGG